MPRMSGAARLPAIKQDADQWLLLNQGGAPILHLFRGMTLALPITATVRIACYEGAE